MKIVIILLKKIIACIKKDFLNTFSYKFSSFLKVCGIVSVVVIIYFLPGSVARRSFLLDPEGFRISYFHFILSGLMFSMYFMPAFGVSSAQVQEVRTIGLLEALLVTPTRFITILISNYIGQLLFFSIANIPILLFIGYCLMDVIAGPNILAIAVISILSVILFAALVILIASFTLIFEDSKPVIGFIISSMRIFGNIYFPVDILPKSLQMFAYCLPFSHIFRAFRRALFGRYNLLDMAPDILVLSAFAIVLFPLSVWSLNHALKKAKDRGTLEKY